GMRGKFVVLPRRWVVERSFAWLGNSRRLSKDYERLTDTAKYLSKLPRYIVFYAEFVRFLNSF
ncbi:MAG: transposase, partial [Methylobacter sp.]